MDSAFEGVALRDLPGRPDLRLLPQHDTPPFAQSWERRGGGRRRYRLQSVGSQAVAGWPGGGGACRLW